MVKAIGGKSILDVGLILTKINLAENMKVADLGCGTTGYFVFPAANMVGKDGIVYAVDIMKTVLDAIEKRKKQENASNVKTVWSDLEIFNATQIEAGSLDVALLINTLYQSEKRIEILREATRLLKKEGKLVLVEWKNIALPFGPPVEERVKKDLIIKAIKKTGLNLEKEFFVSPYHYGLIFTKV